MIDPRCGLAASPHIRSSRGISQAPTENASWYRSHRASGSSMRVDVSIRIDGHCNTSSPQWADRCRLP